MACVRLLVAACVTMVVALMPGAEATEPFPGNRPGLDVGQNLELPYEPSGAAWHRTLANLFIVSDTGKITRMDADGNVLQEWDVSSIWTSFTDFEGICTIDLEDNPENPFVYIGVEYVTPEHSAAIIEFNIDTGQRTRDFILVNFPAVDTGNVLEGLTFVPDTNHQEGGRFYAGHQGDGQIYVYELPIVTGSSQSQDVTYGTVVSPGLGLTGLSGLHYHKDNGSLYAVYDSANRMLELDAISGELIHEWVLPGDGQEGVTVTGCDLYITEDLVPHRVMKYAGFPGDRITDDDDGDGATNCADDCPETPSGEYADAQGCSCTQGGAFAECGNDVCEPAGWESCETCPQDCNFRKTGSSSSRFCCGDDVGVGPVDCSDPRCSDEVIQCMSEMNEAIGGVCGDGLDYDCDLLDDCLDLDCCHDTACGPDSDSDSYTWCDCDDLDAATYPGAPEVNDGEDSQCPGDFGYGINDEISGDSGFHNPANKDEYSWAAQTDATSYEVARSSLPNYSEDCTIEATANTFWDDGTPVPVESCFYYLVRAVAPNIGSWGQDSAGMERTSICP